ncbi:hypothetical protein FOL47_010937 [Perkinsus chesapeaki]|uniref:Uncharacterized protein n=1 Tax=Perkinsus chesapeaki TaxID=330153 RepID=A0A7J6N1W6_PERCH|nr:hypothetical protein FOL47_010937 [Perkinsus chesapeaki]
MVPTTSIYDQVAELERAVDSVPLTEKPRKPPQPSRSGGTSALAQAVSRHTIKLGKPRTAEESSPFGSYSVGNRTSLVGSSSSSPPRKPSSEKRPLYMSRQTVTKGESVDLWAIEGESRHLPDDSEEAKAVLLADLLCDVRAHNRRRDRLAREELLLRNRLARLGQLGCSVEDVQKEVSKMTVLSVSGINQLVRASLRKDRQQPPRSEHPSLWLKAGGGEDQSSKGSGAPTEFPGQDKPVYLEAVRKCSGDISEQQQKEAQEPQLIELTPISPRMVVAAPYFKKADSGSGVPGQLTA